MKTSRFPAALAAALALASCDDGGDRLSGNSANTGNAQATGRILDTTGAPVRGAWVRCRPEELAPWEATASGWTTLTDSAGVYRCVDLPEGPVAVHARDLVAGLSAWQLGQLPNDDARDTLPDDTLRPPGALRVALPPGREGTLWLTGLDLAVSVRGRGQILIADLPAHWRGALRLSLEEDSTTTLAEGLAIASGRIDSTGFTRDSVRVRIPLASGLSGALSQVPVLIRLGADFSGFAASLPDGSDLRVSRPDGTVLPVSVAQWDRGSTIGAVWTLLDTLAAPGDSLDLVVSWGLPVPESAPAAPFTSARGWTAAWGLGDTGEAIDDRTGSFPGVATALDTTSGIVGRASLFDGRTSQVLIEGSDTGALAVAAGASATFSCWTRLADTGTSRFLMGQGDRGRFLKFQRNWGDSTNFWLAKDVYATPSGGRYALSEAQVERWTHLAVTISDSVVQLYVDGLLVDSGAHWDADSYGRRLEPFRIGASADSLGTTSQHYHGAIDEAWVQTVARSAEWIRLVYGNQAAGTARILE